jgi:hypothetical protein
MEVSMYEWVQGFRSWNFIKSQYEMLKPIHPHAIQQMQSDKSLIAYHTLKIEKFKLSELLGSAKLDLP